ncbi:MAG: thymidylate kinase [Oscillospiraceae bacterium]|nr:thymidylate kinase [Oscillospiraceae bacterium]
MSRGKLIVFEGIDGSGKSTQYKLLCEKLKSEGVEFRSLVFPQYSEPSSALIRMYLGGEFGSRPGDVNAYAASTFFAVDRFASYKKEWGEYYENGGLIITDRYATSNAVHQASKLGREERRPFFDWLYDLEYTKMGMPAPDMVVFMDISAEAASVQMRSRESATGTSADIHEKDMEYLASCCEAARDAAEFYSWNRVDCLEDGKMRTIEDIHAEVVRLVSEQL